MTTGEAIRTARKRAGLTQDQLAKLMKVRPLQILRWEKGTATPHRRTRERIARWVAGLAS